MLANRIAFLAGTCVMLLATTVFLQQSAAESSALIDGRDQASLVDIAGNDPKVMAELQAALQLTSRVDITKEFDDGALVGSVRKLKPLRSVSRGQTTTKEVEPVYLTKNPKAYVAEATIWNADNSSAETKPAGRLGIEVCWLNSLTPENERGRNLTRAAVTATWEYYGNVSFTGWQKCAGANPKGIKIRIADERPWSVYGRFSDPETPSMVLNFTFAKENIADCQSKRDVCIYTIAVHEFGHALGFLHEQDSPDTPPGCISKLKPVDIQRAQESLKAKMLTDWDELSVMNYCFDLYSARVQLSDCDIAAYQSKYTKPPKNPYEPECKVRLVPVATK
jgi:hypothetical protein